MILFNSRTPQWAWLSNFAHAPIWINTSIGALHFLNVEAAYQYAKHKPEHMSPPHARVWGKMSGVHAKTWGKNIDVRPDWPTMKVDVMRALLQAKFHTAELALALIDTGDDELFHLSPWDRFWGVDEQHRGENVLGELIMEIRDELTAAQEHYMQEQEALWK